MNAKFSAEVEGWWGTSESRLAEAGGFEPPVGCPTPVFKTGAFGRSAMIAMTYIIDLAKSANDHDRGQALLSPSSSGCGDRCVHESRGSC